MREQGVCALAWKRFRRDRLGFGSLIVVAAYVLLVLVHIAISNLKSFRQSDNPVDVLRTSSHVAFLCTTMQDRIYLSTLS